MRIVARGWRRDCGANEIMTAELGDGYEPDADNSSRVRLRRLKSGDVRIRSGPHNLTLGGDYQVEVVLSLDDLFHLFALGVKDEPFAAVVTLIAKVFGRKGESDKAA